MGRMGSRPVGGQVQVFEIGTTLRQARLQLGLELADVERATRIRARHLAAMEDEHFELLPETAYARAFLREYAQLLGLDARPFVEEFDSRLGEEESPPAVPPREAGPSLRGVMTTFGALLVLAVIGVIGWRLGSGEHQVPTRTATSSRRTAITPPPVVRPTVRPIRPAGLRPLLARLSLSAHGPCWLRVRDGSKDGPVLFEGLLHDGDSLRFARRRLWIRIGAPWNLAARLNGRPVPSLIPDTGNVIVKPSGIQPA